MILLPPDTFKDNINPYYLSCGKRSKLLGFFPCQNNEEILCKYYSCLTEDEQYRFVPVFYINNKQIDYKDGVSIESPVIYFLGCDDGSLGVKVNDEADAIDWIAKCPYVDFNQLFLALCNGKSELIYFN